MIFNFVDEGRKLCPISWAPLANVERTPYLQPLFVWLYWRFRPARLMRSIRYTARRKLLPEVGNSRTPGNRHLSDSSLAIRKTFDRERAADSQISKTIGRHKDHRLVTEILDEAETFGRLVTKAICQAISEQLLAANHPSSAGTAAETFSTVGLPKKSMSTDLSKNTTTTDSAKFMTTVVDVKDVRPVLEDVRQACATMALAESAVVVILEIVQFAESVG